MLEVAAVSGGVAASAVAVDAVPLDPADWDRSWEQGLVPLDAALQEALVRLGIGPRARATLVYHDPDVLAEVFSPPGALADARKAAQLALAEAFPGKVQGCPSALTLLAKDRTGENPRHHLLGVMDRNERLECLCDWLRRAGCTVKELIPAKALLLAHAVNTATAADSDGPTATLLFADHATVIVGVSDGAVRVTRMIAFGHDLLTDAVLRAARGVAGDDATLTRDRAAAELFRVGLPGRDDEFPLADGLTGTQILPLTQPVLQRLAVEIKQTLRFALEESDLSRVRIVLTGTGAAIPGLSTIISESLDAQVDIAEAVQHCRDEVLRPTSELDLVARRRRPAVSLLPVSEVRHRDYRRAVAGVRAGAMLAILSLAGIYLSAHNTERRINAQSASLASFLARARDHATQVQQAAAVEETFRHQLHLVDQALSPRADWQAVLGELSRQASAGVKLTELSAAASGAGPTLVLKGFAELPANAAAADPLGGYIEHLSGSPLFASVDMGPTRTNDMEGRTVKLFTLTLKLHALPDHAEALTDAQPGGPL